MFNVKTKIIIIFLVFAVSIWAVWTVSSGSSNVYSQTTSVGFAVKGVKVLYEGTRVIDSFGENDVNITVIEVQYSTSGLSMITRYKYYIVVTGLKTGDVSISPIE